MKTKWIFFWIFCLLLVLLLSSFEIARSQDYQVDGDFFELWLAGKMSWSDGNIFDTVAWTSAHAGFGNSVNRNAVFPYPPVLAVILSPLGLFSLKWASILWVFLSEIMAIGSVYLLMNLWKRPVRLYYMIPILAGVFLFRPIMVTLRNGQLSIFFLFLVTLSLYFWDRNKWFLGAFVMAFLVIRPNLGIPLLGLVFIWLVLDRHWSGLMGILCSTFMISIISWVYDPNWISAWWYVGDAKLFKTFGHQATIWGVTSYLCYRSLDCTLIAGSVTGLLLFGVFIFLLMKANRSAAKLAGEIVSLIISLTLLLTPYLWAYDQALLVVPLIVISGILLDLKFPYLIVATFPLVGSIAGLICLYVATQVGDDVWSAVLSFLPFLVISVYLARLLDHQIVVELLYRADSVLE